MNSFKDYNYLGDHLCMMILKPDILDFQMKYDGE